MVVDLDDFGSNHIISDMCQTHDCRDALDKLHYANLDFKCTLFAVPGEMTMELLEWCKSNNSWIELGMHGFYHRNNYECDKMTYDEFDEQFHIFSDMLDSFFVPLFKAPGWQISDGIYQWLDEGNWMLADQAYNNLRRPKGIQTYINNDGEFIADKGEVTAEIVPAWHGHTWNCMGNGIYESFDELLNVVRSTTDFKFITEVLS
jgi:hypothetical protein